LFVHRHVRLNLVHTKTIEKTWFYFIFSWIKLYIFRAVLLEHTLRICLARSRNLDRAFIFLRYLRVTSKLLKTVITQFPVRRNNNITLLHRLQYEKMVVREGTSVLFIGVSHIVIRKQCKCSSVALVAENGRRNGIAHECGSVKKS
jgi:hypothetical protein